MTSPCSIVRGNLPTSFSLQPAPLLLLVYALLSGCQRYFRWSPFRLLFESLLQQIDEAFQSHLFVGRLAASLLRDDPENSLFADAGSQPVKDKLFLLWIKAWRIDNVKPECHPGACLVNVLTPGATTAGSGKFQLISGNRELISYPDHGDNIAY